MSDGLDTRWTDNARECRSCGRRLSRTYCATDGECAECLSGVLAVPLPDPDPRDEAYYCSRYPRLTNAQLADMNREQEEREQDDMPIIAKDSGGTFKPAPAGVAMGVCCDVVDLGMQKTKYAGIEKVQHKVRVVWQLADVDPSIGKRPLVSQRYTLSLHEKAALRRDLESWRGRTFNPSELQGFDVERVVGVPCMLNVVHSADGQYANVSAIMPLPKGMTAPKVEGYVRDKDRPKPVADPPEDDIGDHDHDHEDDGFRATDADIPF